MLWRVEVCQTPGDGTDDDKRDAGQNWDELSPKALS